MSDMEEGELSDGGGGPQQVVRPDRLPSPQRIIVATSEDHDGPRRTFSSALSAAAEPGVRITFNNSQADLPVS